MHNVQLIECPRDAMQGITRHIPTQVKIEWLNQLLEVGFDALDFGSFVSPKAVPQMADTAQVYQELNWQRSNTKLLAIVANERGAENALKFEGIKWLGFPLSASETFQMRNTQASIAEALKRLSQIKFMLQGTHVQLVAYISMAFGNPYGDAWSEKIIVDLAMQLDDLGVDIISLADTVGQATPEIIASLFKLVTDKRGNLPPPGLHLHALPHEVAAKTKAALEAGCKRMDTALKGFGGCPFAADKLTGNMDTEMVLQVLEEKGVATRINRIAFGQALQTATKIFNEFH